NEAGDGMISVTSLLLFATPFGIAAALPGPAQTTLVARVLTRGTRDAAWFIMGMVSGNALWLCLAIFGLSALARRFMLLFVAVKWLGIAYLLVLAWKLWRASPKARGPPHGRRGVGGGGGSA